LPISAHTSRLPVAACFLLAVAVRAVVALRVHIPGRDGATYLWMAEQIADGNFAASFGTVFPPVYPWTIAVVLWLCPNIDPVLAGQIASGLLGACAIFPLWAVTERLFDRQAALLACTFYALGTWFARHPADCMTEGPFYLLVALTVLLLLRGPKTLSTIGIGLLIGLAFGTRPEGASLAIVGIPWLWLRDKRQALVLALAAAAFGLCTPFGYAIWGQGFTLTPKATFMWPHGAGRDEGGGVLFYLDHLWRVPGHAFEAVGYVAMALAIVGVVTQRARGMREGTSLLIGLFLLQIAIIPLARSTLRFVSGYGMLMLAFTGPGLRWLQSRWGLTSTWAKVALALLAFGPDLVRIPKSQREDKTIERDLAQHLRQQMAKGDLIVSAEHRESSSYDLPFSMCRIEYFVGMEPSPPRPLTVDELRQMAKNPRTKFGLLAGDLTGIGAADLVAMGYRVYELPADLGERAAQRRITVFERLP
jgi:hypothetical protein